METELTELIAQRISTLEEDKRLLKETKETFIDTLDQQRDKFLELFNKIKPILLQVLETKGSFYNSELDLNSPHGPVIAATNQEMYVFDVRSRTVKKYRIFDYEEISSNIHLATLFEHFSFKTAYTSLVEQIDYHQNLVERINKKIDQARQELESI
ncbi:hypothetical protein EFK13_13355 [Bacillus cabrialesii]|uniref:hypothetical protein n=1 Tax=Bacillus cabrialesii TaxID=2487276 RepID=UPI00101383B7|nr:hypothetical protein [Bacillus cabrialesii]UQE77758.1 hypothetical protein EFK13_13355 [Bacillus cabrialesii]